MKTLLAALALALLPAAPALAAQPSPPPPVSLDAPGDAPAKGERLTIGVQPATAKAPDRRPHFTYALGARDVVTDHVAVFNYSAAPVTLRLYARDALTTRSGALDVQPADARPTGAGAWLALATPELTLKPRTRVIVPFQLGVPYDATPGDHTGAIVASLTTTSTNAEGRRVDVENRVGLRVYLRVRGAVHRRLAVEGLAATWGGGAAPFGRGPVDVSFTLRNTGNVRLGARERVVVRNAFGRTVGTATLDDAVVLLPGSAVPVKVRLDDVLGTARMSATVTAEPLRLEGDTGPALPPVTRRVRFWALPWLPAAALLALLAGLVLWRRRAPRPARHRKARRDSAPPRHAADDAKVPVALFAGLAVVVAVLVSVGGTAFAGSGPWAATLTDASGADDTPIELVTSGGCPAPATNVVAKAYGHGLPAGGYNVVGNTSAGVRPDAAFKVPLTVTMRDVARDQATLVSLRGRYRFEVVCRTARDPRPLGTYVAGVTFSSPTRWTADRPLTTAQGPVSAPPAGGGDAAGAAPHPGAPGSTVAPGTPGATGGPLANGGPGAGVLPGGLLPGSAGSSDSGGSLLPVALLLLVAAGLPAAFVAGRRRGAAPSPEGTSRP